MERPKLFSPLPSLVRDIPIRLVSIGEGDGQQLQGNLDQQAAMANASTGEAEADVPGSDDYNFSSVTPREPSRDVGLLVRNLPENCVEDRSQVQSALVEGKIGIPKGYVMTRDEAMQVDQQADQLDYDYFKCPERKGPTVPNLIDPLEVATGLLDKNKQSFPIASSGMSGMDSLSLSVVREQEEHCWDKALPLRTDLLEEGKFVHVNAPDTPTLYCTGSVIGGSTAEYRDGVVKLVQNTGSDPGEGRGWNATYGRRYVNAISRSRHGATSGTAAT